MRLETKKYLYDIQKAASQIMDFTSGKTLEDYRGNAMLRSAVERQFEIIGEALSQLAMERKALALLVRQRETNLAETGLNRVSFDGHGLSNGFKAQRIYIYKSSPSFNFRRLAFGFSSRQTVGRGHSLDQLELCFQTQDSSV